MDRTPTTITPTTRRRIPMTARAFRFGVVTALAGSAEEWTAKARRTESLGYSTLVTPDRLQYTLAPMPALAAAAVATRSLRVGTYVIANDFRNPVLLAKEAATLDLVSGGRLELGIGIGLGADAAPNPSMLGIPADSTAARTERLRESLRMIKGLWAGQAMSATGSGYAAVDAQIFPRPVQQQPPILMAAWGRRLLTLAGQEADIVALGAPPTEPETSVAERIGWLRDAAGARFDQIELNVNLMAVGDAVPQWIADRMGLTAADLAASGALSALMGSPEQMCDTLLKRREALGISYVLVGDELMDALAPVVERLAGR
jgi:probable F420-dependent oxidoreductase